MNYLINRKTKEHRILKGEPPAEANIVNFPDGIWDIVKADAFGWIKHNGVECPLPKDWYCDIQWNDAATYFGQKVSNNIWEFSMNSKISHYRPLVAESHIEATKTDAMPHQPQPSIFERLNEAYEQAALIPSLIEELNAQLPQGLRVCEVGLDFAAGKDWTAEAIWLKEDMTDWRNWKAGDELICLEDCGNQFSRNKIYILAEAKEENGYPRVNFEKDDRGSENGWLTSKFEFYNRP